MNFHVMRKVILMLMLWNTITVLFARDHKELIDTRPLKSINLNLLGDG